MTQDGTPKSTQGLTLHFQIFRSLCSTPKHNCIMLTDSAYNTLEDLADLHKHISISTKIEN